MKKIITFIIIITFLIIGLVYCKPIKVLNVFGIIEPNNNIEYNNFIMKIPNRLSHNITMSINNKEVIITNLYGYKLNLELEVNGLLYSILDKFITFGFDLYFKYTNNSSYYDNLRKNNKLTTIYDNEHLLMPKKYIPKKIFFLENEKDLNIIISFYNSKNIIIAFDYFYEVLKKQGALLFEKKVSCNKYNCMSIHETKENHEKAIFEIIKKKHVVITYKLANDIIVQAFYQNQKKLDSDDMKNIQNSIFEASEKYNEKVNKKDDKDLLKIGSDFWK